MQLNGATNFSLTEGQHLILPNHVKTTEARNVTQTLQGLIKLFEEQFPNRIRGYYLEGSYADQIALTTSDVDLIILFKDSFTDKTERGTATLLGENYDSGCELELDIELLAESDIVNGVPPALKLGSQVIFGEPLPEHLPLISVADWGRKRMHAAYWLIAKVFNRPDIIRHPLDYPKPDAEFYGYTNRRIRLADGRELDSTRNLIRVIGWAATALIALQSNHVVASKKECHILYRKYINDEWAIFLESLYQQCREEWLYLIPDQIGERRKLMGLCQRALEFENHFLRIYRQFLLSELRNSDESVKRRALQLQAEIPYADEDIVGLVQKLL